MHGLSAIDSRLWFMWIFSFPRAILYEWYGGCEESSAIPAVNVVSERPVLPGIRELRFSSPAAKRITIISRPVGPGVIRITTAKIQQSSEETNENHTRKTNRPQGSLK